uniref:OSJNBa0032N05.17 protein n=1 Tax=Oryza sativa subsp. japonica TaxID=39947 RepID=Q5CAI1_ORYSJ|nr:OSJNBa0032N05.17 [Oryza sativa Japonica Group]
MRNGHKAPSRPWTLTSYVRSAATRVILGMTARKPVRRRCTWATTITGIVHKEVKNNNGYRPQGGQGWNQPRPYYLGGNNNGNFSNQPSLKDLVFAQAKTTDTLSRKLAAIDKVLENINVKLDGFASAFQNQLSFNKMIETQLAQLASLVPAYETGRIPGQPDSSIENVKVITTRGGSNGISKEAPSNDSADKEVQPEKTVPQEYCDTRALCDLGVSVSVMPKDVFDKLNFTVLAPTPMRLQLAGSSVHYPAGIAEDVPVKIRDFFIPVDFVVLDMETGKETLLILGRPFLSTAGANIDVGTGSIRFHINGKEEKFEFQPRTEQCSKVRIKYGPNLQNIQEVEVEPPKTDSLVKFMQNFLEKETTMPSNRYWRTPVKPPVPAKQLEQSAQKKLPSAPKTKKVWREKPKTPTPSPAETGGKSMN